MKNGNARSSSETPHPEVKTGQTRTRRGLDYTLLWGIVLLLLAFNLALAWLLNDARQQVKVALQQVETFRQQLGTRLGEAGTAIENMKGSSLEYTATIDQSFPIDMTIPLDYEVEVPVNLIIPIKTKVNIPIPGIGTIFSVPVEVEVPVDTIIKVPIKMSIPVKTSVPIKIEIPVSINIADTFLADSLEEIQTLFEQLSIDLDGLSLDFSKQP